MRTLVLDACIILILAAVLVKPLFKVQYLDRWQSIEPTFIADARFIRDHGPHQRWQPLWYGGTRFDYIYPPALRYGTAAVARVLGVVPEKAYHIYTAFFYCFGIAAVYLFVRLVSGGRGAAWLVAGASALVSPSFLFLPVIRADAPLWVPQRLGVLLRYGEGPHITALAWIPVALAFAWLALERHRPAAIAAAAVAGAMVVAHNFYGTTAYAALYGVLAWSLWVTGRDRTVWRRAAIVVALTYGLTAFWLTPSYFAVTAYNMRFVAERGNTGSAVLFAAVMIAYALLSWRLASGRDKLAYPVFLAGALLFFAVNVLGFYAAGFRVVGEPKRWIPELDWIMILAAVETLRRLWGIRRGRTPVRVATAALVAAAFTTAAPYVRRAWWLYPVTPDYRERLEYRMQDWVVRNLPGARVLATGTVRFWLDAWNDVPQLGGGSDQGVENRLVMPALHQIQRGDDARTAIGWMTALGVDAVIVNGPQSREFYHDFSRPQKFAGLLPMLFDNGQGDTVYRVPRRWPGLARVVDGARFSALRAPVSEQDAEALRVYLAAAEDGSRAPAALTWHGTDVFTVSANTEAGEAVLVQETWDPAWRASAVGKPLRVRKDAVGWMLIDAPPGENEIRVTFGLPLENAVGRGLTALTLLAMAALTAQAALQLPAYRACRK